MVTFDDIVPKCESSQALSFVRTWHAYTPGFAVVTRISSRGKHIVHSIAGPATWWMHVFEDDISELVHDEAGTWNMYISCATHTVDPTEGGRKRGGRKTIGWVPGVWLDLDVKPDSFGSTGEIYSFLAELPFPPSIEVLTGSGGMHAYWAFDHTPLGEWDGHQLCEAWWAYCTEIAGKIFIDDVSGSERILRVPGTVRWPKEEEDRPHPVQLILADGPRTPAESLADVTRDAYVRLGDRKKVLAEKVWETDTVAALALEGVADLVGWPRLFALGNVEEIFNSTTTWEQILVPRGWVCLGEDYEGRKHWSRPGQRGKSAHTDYPASPHVMVLFSNALETGLTRLKDAGVPLTKFRVHAELTYGGNITALVKDIVKG